MFTSNLEDKTLRTILGIVAFAVVAIAVGILFTDGGDRRAPSDLPWQVQTSPDGGSRVLGITLGQTPLAAVESRLGEEAEVTLFVSPDGKYSAEAYFDNVDLSGLRARLVLTMALAPKRLEAIYSRGLRISRAQSGARKVSMAPEDAAEVRRSPIAGITYMPRINLDETIITQRFGIPAERIREPDNTVVHWLYPRKGVDIALDARGKEVFQYVRPDKFETIAQPLRDRGTRVTD